MMVLSLFICIFLIIGAACSTHEQVSEKIDFKRFICSSRNKYLVYDSTCKVQNGILVNRDQTNIGSIYLASENCIHLHENLHPFYVDHIDSSDNICISISGVVYYLSIVDSNTVELSSGSIAQSIVFS